MFKKPSIPPRSQPASAPQPIPSPRAEIQPAEQPAREEVRAVAGRAQPAAAAPAGSTTASPAPEPESRLTVGPNIKLKGVEITDCDTLVVEGRVEASMDSRVIQIAKAGTFKGSVAIDRAEIYGQFDGELTAREQLIVHSTGRVFGKIRYGKIAIEEGGIISGDIDAIQGGGQRREADGPGEDRRGDSNVEQLKSEREKAGAGSAS